MGSGRRQQGGSHGRVDHLAPRQVGLGAAVLLESLHADLKAGRFAPLPVREKTIPKASGKLRRLGIPTTRDRVMQAALKLVLEPIFVWLPSPAPGSGRDRRDPLPGHPLPEL
jgi:RNA-directed DNA polymerase